MKALRTADGEALHERRARGRRASDLDGAYNDGGRPTPLHLANGIGLYGGIIWVVLTSAIGTFFILQSAWDFLAELWAHT